MRENSKDFELGVAMLPAKEQRAVPIGGASLVSWASTREKSGVSVPDLSGQRRLEPLLATSPA
jgi:hypothetical protein